MPDATELAERPASSAGEAAPFVRWLIRTRAYFRKEVHELRRQPLLILSLIGGPLLVLLLFGASFRSSNPLLRTVVVLPPGGIDGISRDRIQALVGANFTLLDITEDRAGAEAQLRAGQLDVVQVLPADALAAVQRGESPEIEFLSNAIDPLAEGWIQYLAYAETNEINKALLKQQTIGAQTKAGEIKLKVADAGAELALLEGTLTQQQLAAIQADLRALKQSLALFAAQLPAAGTLLGAQADLVRLREALARAQRSLDTIDSAISEGTVQQRLEDLRAARQDLQQIEGLIEIFVMLSPDAVVSPIRQKYANIRGAAYASVIYYSPGVLALLIQHTAITLGALALVRERLMGAFEIFRVAPVGMVQLLIGKYLGYTLFIGLTAAVLIVAMLLTGVPLLGNPLLFVALILLLTLASLGIGFLISTISGSDSQAIQLAMIALLLSIFFSGFFIGLDSFARPALAISYSIPMTHGVRGFQSLMLRGIAPGVSTWVGLAIISAVSFVLVVLLTRRQFQQA
ncbi:MAG TPA: ABC transporter permease [Roseiflexaceae bacterium]|nr:ABC transporter permease [Roseiflexaceae bacterium]